MMEICTFESIADFSTCFFIWSISRVVEVVSSCTNNYNKSAAIINESGEPKKSEEEVKGKIGILFLPF